MNIDNKLNKIKVKLLSQSEKDSMWQDIGVGMNKNNLSIFNLLLSRKPAVNIILAILVIFGASIATVQASDNAKPGDVLYVIDRAVENIQITFASKENKDKLKIEFAEERILEIQNVIKERIVVEYDEDDLDDDELDTEEIEESVQTALDYISEVRNELSKKNNQGAINALNRVMEKFQDKLGALPEDLEIEIDVEEDEHKIEFKIESKNENNKFKLKFKSEDDGEFKIELENKKKEGIEDNNEDRGRSKRNNEDDEENEDHDSEDDEEDQD